MTLPCRQGSSLTKASTHFFLPTPVQHAMQFSPKAIVRVLRRQTVCVPLTYDDMQCHLISPLGGPHLPTPLRRRRLWMVPKYKNSFTVCISNLILQKKDINAGILIFADFDPIGYALSCCGSL